MTKRKAQILGPNGQAFATPAEPPQPWVYHSSRSWPASGTDRLNEAAWSGVEDSSLNVLLADRLSTIAKRSEHEIRRNGIVAGMVATHVTDIVGESGPSLQVEARDNDDTMARRYADELENVWREWFQSPDVNEELSGADFLDLDVNMLWRRGESLTQIVTGDSPGPVRMRLHSIHPRRLETPIGDISSGDVALGIRRNATGRALEYWI